MSAPNPTPLHLAEPLGIDEARQASRALASQRREAERTLEMAAVKAAEAERDYRLAKAKEWAKVSGEGTAKEREAMVDAATAQLRYDRDLAVSMQKLTTERLRGLEGERAQLRALLDMSGKTYGAVA